MNFSSLDYELVALPKSKLHSTGSQVKPLIHPVFLQTCFPRAYSVSLQVIIRSYHPSGITNRNQIDTQSIQNGD